jgi:hypothetical protein
MDRTPERRAWLILLVSLLICCALGVGVPGAALTYINSATTDAIAYVQLQKGILTTFSPFQSESDARAVGLSSRRFYEGHTVTAGSKTVGALTFSASENGQTSTKIQLYSFAKLRLERARVPRFVTDAARDDIQLEMLAGRIQVLAQPLSAHNFKIVIRNEHGDVSIEQPGVYSLEMNANELIVEVIEGAATINLQNAREPLTLQPGQRTSASKKFGARGALPKLRDLIRNSHFGSTLTRDWGFAAQANNNSPKGIVIRSEENGKGFVVFERVGEKLDWGRTVLTQTINEDVSGRPSLRLRLSFSILVQELDVCGGEGTECPLFARIDYQNKDGSPDYWLQGFYAKGDPVATDLPVVVRSNDKGDHVFKPIGSSEIFESENLLIQLPNLKVVKSISIYAEGHALRTRVDSVALLLQE